MIKNFKPAYIAKNNKDLINKLINLGYIGWACYSNEPYIYITTFNFKWQSSSAENKEEPIIATTTDEFEYVNVTGNYINCGTDEELFLKIAKENLTN